MAWGDKIFHPRMTVFAVVSRIIGQTVTYHQRPLDDKTIGRGQTSDAPCHLSEPGGAGAMRINRSRTTAIVVSPMIYALGLTGQGIHGLRVIEFTGSFVLPFEADWAGVTLPAGKYILCFGTQGHGIYFVEIRGRDKGSPHGIVLIQGHQATCSIRNALVCIREGNSQIVRSLEMTAIGKSVQFELPRAMRLQVANESFTQASAQPAE